MQLDTIRAVETPEGIHLSLRPAGPMARSLAYLIDMGIRIVIYIAMGIATSRLGGMGGAAFLIGVFALEWLYPVVFELSRSAATPGKRAMGLRVVMDSGLPVTPAASLVRNLLRAADFMPGLYAGGIVAMLLRSDFKRLGDMAAGTLVVYGSTVRLHGDIPAAEPRAPARPLSMREQTAIVSWAGRATRLTPARFDELARLAEPLIAADAAGTGAPGASTRRLLGIAHWITGRRADRAG